MIVKTIFPDFFLFQRVILYNFQRKLEFWGDNDIPNHLPTMTMTRQRKFMKYVK